MSRAKSWIKRLFLLAPTGRESGQALAEYSLMFAMVVVASVMAVTAIGLTTEGNFLDFLSALT